MSYPHPSSSELVKFYCNYASKKDLMAYVIVMVDRSVIMEVLFTVISHVLRVMTCKTLHYMICVSRF
jgi:hypothetical protein